jgi:lipopolysaccharide biosynthesis glycosyltransferase
MQAIAALIEDIAESGEDVSALVNQHGLTAERRMRAEVKSPHPPARLKGLPDLALCYCTDASYFPPALVSIVSFAISNAWLARRTRINFLAGDDAMDRVPELQGIARRLGVSLEVKRAADIVPPDAELSGRYGFFTGGQALSSAAYYRIFLARALAAAGDVPQALYIDADTVIQPGLDQLFDTPMVQPLMARPDADRDEIKSLERAYGLKHSYFNSGVLRFDLRHAAALPALDAAIGCAIDPGRNLAFHDQCALNIGFNGQVDVLPERFNWFSSPDHLKPGQKPSDGVIVHYLDRTKPWDSLYQGDASGWFMYHALARRLAELG